MMLSRRLRAPAPSKRSASGRDNGDLVTTTQPASVLLEGLVFPESPRWYEGRLWFSDVYARQVLAVGLDGQREIVAQLDDDPSGLGFLPDGTPIVALMRRRQVIRLVAGRTEVHADLSDMPVGFLNDMVVDGRGRAYVDCSVVRRFGGDGAECIAVIEPSGAVQTATSEVYAPNGLAVTEDGTRLLCASPLRRQLTSFRIEPDGKLADRAVVADTMSRPDGICLDASGAVWIGALEAHACQRIAPGGAVLEAVSAGNRSVTACVLGGVDRRTLFLTTVEVTGEHFDAHMRSIVAGDAQVEWGGQGPPQGFIEVARVGIPGVGWP